MTRSWYAVVVLALVMLPASASLWEAFDLRANTPEADADQVHSLPTLDGPISPAFYSGYLTVDEKAGRHLFYAFAESQGNPATDPLVLWSNGGPGCSSVGEGLWMEHGPYQVMNEAPGIRRAPYSWNRVANMLYVEHPVGVGFSYSDTPSDYTTLNDDKEADDLFNSLVEFLKRFPRYENSSLYLSGESYGTCKHLQRPFNLMFLHLAKLESTFPTSLTRS